MRLSSHYREMPASSSNTWIADLGSDHVADRERAWRTLYDLHYERVYRLVCRLGIEPGEVEDIVQRAFMVAFRRLGEVDDVRDPIAWLRGIVVRVVAQHRRWRRVREAKRWLLGELPAAGPPPVITPERNVAAAEELEKVRTVLGCMSTKLRDVLVLCDIEDCSHREAAELLAVPVNTVRSRRQRARAEFLSRWRRKYGGTP